VTSVEANCNIPQLQDPSTATSINCNIPQLQHPPGSWDRRPKTRSSSSRALTADGCCSLASTPPVTIQARGFSFLSSFFLSFILINFVVLLFVIFLLVFSFLLFYFLYIFAWM
jgi:hypothetical protein